MPDPIEVVVGGSSQSTGAGNQQTAGKDLACRRSHLRCAAAKEQQLLRIPSIEREVQDALGLHHISDAEIASFDQSRICLYFDLFGNLTDLNRDVDRRVCI